MVIPLPPHAYVPGRNARHPEDWFDAIKDSVTPGMNPSVLHLTAAFRAGLIYFEKGYFWECHEVLEAVWMQTPQGSQEREMVQAVIQLSNAKLKLVMERPKAAQRLCAIVAAHLDHCSAGQVILGLTSRQVKAWLEPVRLAAD